MLRAQGLNNWQILQADSRTHDSHHTMQHWQYWKVSSALEELLLVCPPEVNIRHEHCHEQQTASGSQITTMLILKRLQSMHSDAEHMQHQ